MPDYVGPEIFESTQPDWLQEKAVAPFDEPSTNYSMLPLTQDTLPSASTPTFASVPSSTTAAISDDQLNGDYYRVSYIDGCYEWDEGLILQPVCGPAGTPAEILRVSGGRAFRVVEWVAERVGSMPVVPSWVTNNPNEVLFRKKICPITPAMGPDGTLIYKLRGRYVYALRVMPGDADRLSSGTTPYTTIASSQNDVLLSSFDQNQMNSSSTVPGNFNPPPAAP